MPRLLTLTTFSTPRISMARLHSVAKSAQAMPEPSFVSHCPDFAEIARVCKPFQKYKNILVIGNGGSRTSALALANVCSRSNKHVEFITTMDPTYIERLRKTYRPSDTLVMPISKSGTNVDVLEPLSAFWKRYPVLACTGTSESVLFDIAKAKRWSVLVHPDIGGRFSGRSACSFGLLHLLGVRTGDIDAGARAAYRSYAYDADPMDNDALRAALLCYDLEQEGYTEIFASFYSIAYGGFLPLLVQLMHETVCKKGKGQTVFGDLAPESHHHTNQRFFGGRRNVIGCFLVDESAHKQRQPQVSIPARLRSLPLRGGTLGDLHGLPLGAGLRCDFEGVFEHAMEEKIPSLVLSLRDSSAKSAGRLMAFFQFFAIYSALARNVNPFDQPEVERAKDLTLKKIVAV